MYTHCLPKLQFFMTGSSAAGCCVRFQLSSCSLLKLKNPPIGACTAFCPQPIRDHVVFISSGCACKRLLGRFISML